VFCILGERMRIALDDSCVLGDRPTCAFVEYYASVCTGGMPHGRVRVRIRLKWVRRSDETRACVIDATRAYAGVGRYVDVCM
jgi:hypothetical protein